VSELPRTIAGPADAELVIKKSRFLAHLHPVNDLADAEQVVAGIRKQFWDARHHCVAMVLGVNADQQRSTDDGEPSGTAGVSMLEVLHHHQLTDVVAVVTRYFGGVLLGAGGLVRAYSGVVGAAVENAHLLRREFVSELRLNTDYAAAGRLESFLRDWLSNNGGVLDDISYNAEVEFTFAVPPDHVVKLQDDLASVSSGVLQPTLTGQRIAEFPVNS
jgi:uncharacterized YigZ family protein